jgi:hypothetical protein
MNYRGNIIRSTCCDNGVTFWPTAVSIDELISDIIIDGNRFDSVQALYIEAKRVTVRNNILVDSLIQPTSVNGCTLPDGWISDLKFYNNSGFGGATLIETFWTSCFVGAGMFDSFSWFGRNNLNYPGESVGNIGAGVKSDNYGGSNLPSRPYAGSSPTIGNTADWGLTGPSGPVITDAGFTVGSVVYRDIENEVRPVGAGYDVGAIEGASGIGRNTSGSRLAVLGITSFDQSFSIPRVNIFGAGLFDILMRLSRLFPVF